MKVDASTQQIIRSFSHFMHRYHVIIFAAFVLGGLSLSTFLLYQATTTAAPTAPQSSPTNFDKSTITRISKLRGATDAPTPLVLPPGRTNPFQD